MKQKPPKPNPRYNLVRYTVHNTVGYSQISVLEVYDTISQYDCRILKNIFL